MAAALAECIGVPEDRFYVRFRRGNGSPDLRHKARPMAVVLGLDDVERTGGAGGADGGRDKAVRRDTGAGSVPTSGRAAPNGYRSSTVARPWAPPSAAGGDGTIHPPGDVARQYRDYKPACSMANTLGSVRGRFGTGLIPKKSQ